MAYTINKTDGTIFATVQDGTINNTASSLIMIGKNYAGWGEALNENFVRLLESHSSSTEPVTPIKGQLWFNSSAGVLTVYNGENFKPLGPADTQITKPTDNTAGDLWFDVTNQQLNVYNGTEFILVGPAFTTSGTTGTITEVIEDIISVDHTIIKMFVDDEVVGIISKDAEFTPKVAIAGFATTIAPGIQLATVITGQVPEFTGTATNALKLGGLVPSSFLSTIANDTTTGTIGILNDGGLRVGADSDLQLSVSGLNGYIDQATEDGNLHIRVNVGGSTTSAISIDGTTGLATVLTPVTLNNIATKGYVDGPHTMTGDLDMGTFQVVNAGDPVNDLTTDMQDVVTKNYIITAVLEALHPVGSLHFGPDPTGTIPGTWVALPADTFLMASGAAGGFGATGGTNSTTLTNTQLPTHTHTASSLTAGAHTHDVRGIENSVVTRNSLSATGNAGTGAILDVAGAALSAGSHSHGITVQNAGTGAAWDSRPKYESVEVWKRTA